MRTTLLDLLKADLLGGADAAFDTLKELQTAILSDESGITALLTALDKRVRFDAAQALTAAASTSKPTMVLQASRSGLWAARRSQVWR